MGFSKVKSGLGKRKNSVAGQKLLKQNMVKAIVKKLKAEGKPVNLEKINKEVFDKVRRRR